MNVCEVLRRNSGEGRNYRCPDVQPQPLKNGAVQRELSVWPLKWREPRQQGAVAETVTAEPAGQER